MEFGRTPPGHVCNVLAVLGDTEDLIWATFGAAVELAQSAHARLTLVKTCDDGRAYVWIAPFATGSAYIPPILDTPEDAARVLAGVAEQVPADIPVTTFVLGPDTQCSLLKLLRGGQFGAIVAEASLLSHSRRLRRQLRRDGLRTVSVTADCPPGSAGNRPAQFSVQEVTEDGAFDADQIIQGRRGRRHLGVRHWYGRRLAGAGGEQ